MIAVINSVIQKECHTPASPKNWLNTKANGTMMMRYRSKETARDSFPFPSPSNAPLDTTETEETMKPQEIIRSAEEPAVIVAVCVVNIFIKISGVNIKSAVPTAMIPKEIISASI